mgnify:CR=1 FL=1
MLNFVVKSLSNALLPLFEKAFNSQSLHKRSFLVNIENLGPSLYLLQEEKIKVEIKRAASTILMIQFFSNVLNKLQFSA